MAEREDVNVLPDDTVNANDSSGDEGEAALRKKLKSKKKKAPGMLKDQSMKSASSTETSSKKPPSSKARRAKTMNDADGSGKIIAPRRKSTETSGKDSSLSVICKARRRGSKTVGDESSAISGGSGQSFNRKGGRTRSPGRDNDDNSNPSIKKKGSSSRRKSAGGASQQQQQGFDPEASGMWDVPSFGVGSETSSTNKQEGSGFASAFDSGTASGFSDFNDATFSDNALFSPSAFGGKPENKGTEAITGAPIFFNDTQAAFDSGESSAFGGNAFGGASHRDSLEKSPHTDPPRRKIGKLSLVKRAVFSQKFACPPVKNPVTGNIIFCTSRDGEMYIQEVDPMRNYVQVLSSPILTPELHKKVTAKYSRSAYGIDNVLKLCVGIHQAHGQPRVRVVACIDLLVLDSKHILRAILVWQWGYGSSQPVSLQFLLSPPSGTDYAYDPESILAGDNIVFVAGASAKGPCVFMCKPSLRESWSANFLAPSGKITSMAVTAGAKRKHPYLAVGMADGSLSVWTYAAALRQAASKKSEPFRRLLYPLCRLDALWVINSVQPTNFTEEHRQKAADKADAGMCTNLEWLPPQSSLSSLLLLSAGFQGGFAVFHVALPYVASDGKFIPIPVPTQSTQLAATPQLRPFAAVRFPNQLQDVYVSWLDFGPHNNPCIALLLHGRSQDDEPGKVVLGAINTVEYRKGIKSKENLASFRSLATASWRSKSKAFPRGLLSCSGVGAVVCHIEEGIVTLHPSFSNSMKDPTVMSLRHPIFSNPPGVDSTGEVFATDGVSDREGILHVFSLSQCDLAKNDQHPNMLNWTRPARRHWLCRTVCGDRKEMQVKEESKESSQFGDDEDLAVGGSLSDIVCELEGKALSGLVPYRIVRCKGEALAAVLFRHSLGYSAQGIVSGVSTDCVSIALVNTEKGGDGINEIVEGRDVAFMPSLDTTTRALVLGRDGSTISLCQRAQTGWSTGASFRPILGVKSDDNYIEAQRIFVVSSDGKYGLVVLGRRFSDDRACCLRGPMASIDQFSEYNWTDLLPEMAPSEPCLWLQEEEELISLVTLPGRPGSQQKLAVATSARVLILNMNLGVVAKSKVSLASGALAPLGSSTVSFCSSEAKVQYLTCLQGRLSFGNLSNLPMPRFGYGSHLLLAVRPDRVLLINWHSGSTLAEHKDDPDCFMLPTAVTKPAILLEPLVANAICEVAKSAESAVILRGVIEKFGRKVASITHGDDEGVGNRGAGITPRVYELLSKHGYKQAASWLLTGGVQFERSTNSKILPPWMPVAAKREAALNSDAFLHLVANGDQYMSEYFQSPDQNMPSNLPRPGDATPYFVHESGQEALARGDAGDALKMLDIAGTESTETMLLQLSTVLEIKSGDNTDVLKSLCGYDDGSLARSESLPTATASLAALSVATKLNGSNGMNKNQLERWMKPLAPSLQRGTQFGRARQRLLGEKELASVGGAISQAKRDPQWMTPCNESRHIWNDGPNKEKECLLLLGNVGDWLGTRRPTLLGKAGVQAAEERGEGALANILDMAQDDEPEGIAESDNESIAKGWDEGVGEGRQDEDNLSGYYRFWEGEDEESPWGTEGFSDLSRFQSKAAVVGQVASIIVQPTTSSVDEGDPGKVKPLYDVVFAEAGDQEPSGLAIAAKRGNSADVGVLHQKDRSARQRCTIEFWYYLPSASMLKGETILVRRTFGEDADDFSKVCTANDKRSMLWEVALMKSGELQIRTCGGTVIKSRQKGSEGDVMDEDSERKDLVVFERWNHACIVLSSRDSEKTSDCMVSLFMMGSSVASNEASMLPPGLREDELESKADGLLEKSHLVFGSNHPANFRLTEIRIWACQRSEDDVKMMMREYLDAAESRKKKFRVKIGKNKKGGAKGGMLVPPKAGGLAPPKGGLTPPKAGLAPPKGSKGSLLAPPKGSVRPGLLAPHKGGLLAPPKDNIDMSSSLGMEASKGNQSDSMPDTGFEATFAAFGESDALESSAQKTEFSATPTNTGDDAAAWGALPKPDSSSDSAKLSLWEGAIPLSQQVRSSAAAALIRGPPATRHFGGNRGGLPDLKGTDRYGVGGIAICGSEKTIVWRDEEDPPALTYPIGASGAIVSDQLDDEEGSEFLCCFLAKDKRMVVFELNSRTVVVELQMTTKLNFWRFLPPEAGQSTLCFMLITPVGGFHWMPLDDSPRPRQVWKRGSDLQGKKIVSYEEGGSNAGTGPEMIARCGLICVTDSNGTGTLEAWIVPICGDSGAILASSDAQGAAFCVPEEIEGTPFLPHLVQVIQDGDTLRLTFTAVVEPAPGSVGLGQEIVSEVLPTSEFKNSTLDPPTLAMGVFPEALICSLGNIIVVVLRTMGVMLAYELKNSGLKLIVNEDIGHYVVDAVMRYSVIEGGAEIVMLLSDNENHKDGRIASYYFRSTV